MVQAEPSKPLRGKGSIVQAEDRSVGRVTLAVYKTYLGAWSVYYLIPATMLGLSMSQQGMVVRPCSPRGCAAASRCWQCLLGAGACAASFPSPRWASAWAGTAWLCVPERLCVLRVSPCPSPISVLSFSTYCSVQRCIPA